MVTLYNRYENKDTKQVEWRRTVLSGQRANGKGAVHWEDNRAANVLESGLASADAVSVMIWFDVTAEGKTYTSPRKYAALSPAASANYWTMTQGHDRLLKGEGPEIVGDVMINTIAAMDSCITISSVDTMDYGSASMQHWEVSGK